MEAVYFSPVPCQSSSGGRVSGSPTSTGMECPWLARIRHPSALKE